MIHQPVLLKEVIKYLDPSSGENFIDCTLGFGGHSLSLLKQNKPEGKVLGIERDKKSLEVLKDKVSDKRLILVQDNFVNLKKIVNENNFYPVSGILFDLGMSSWQIEQSGRGFSFMREEPLDMRFGSTGPTAEEIINQWPEQELVKILKEYGQERYARSIVRSIINSRKVKSIKTTGQLVEIIKQAVPKNYQYGRIHFATRSFQALRIAVNDELNNLKKVLPDALEVLENEGRLVVISFHSLEDRIVKNFFRQESKENHLIILTKKPIRAGEQELGLNPRSRSAKLRAASKVI